MAGSVTRAAAVAEPHRARLLVYLREPCYSSTYSNDVKFTMIKKKQQHDEVIRFMISCLFCNRQTDAGRPLCLLEYLCIFPLSEQTKKSIIINFLNQMSFLFSVFFTTLFLSDKDLPQVPLALSTHSLKKHVKQTCGTHGAN